jgi:hypothetical protein
MTAGLPDASFPFCNPAGPHHLKEGLQPMNCLSVAQNHRTPLLFSFLLTAMAVLALVFPQVASAVAVPDQYGQVLFSKEGDSRDKHIYIIGHSHRSALSGANGQHTISSQAQVYRIGEWLIRDEGIDLLLPEGFFRRQPAAAPVTPVAYRSGQATILDRGTLEEQLADTRAFVNADILLTRNYGIRLQQVEDEKVYRAVGEVLRSIVERQPGEPKRFCESELRYLQEMRSAVMLQNIATVVDEEFRQGHIAQRKAIFTIGMAHVGEIIRFLENEKISIAPAKVAGYQPYADLLKLTEAGYGVTVILPRTLFDDQEALRLARLDGI